MTRRAGRFCISGSSVGGQEALASHLPVCSQVHSRPSCALRCIAGNSFPRFPLPTGLSVCWTLGKTKRLREEVNGPASPPQTSLLHASTFTPWSRSAGQLHHGLAPLRGAPLTLPSFFCPSNLLLLSSRVSHHPLASWPFHLCKEFPVFYFN